MPPTLARLAALILGCTLSLSAQANDAGANLYRAQCAYCHGSEGQGSKRYKSTLAGDHSVAQLAKVVQETMPESDPGSLTADEAKSVAEFMHREFYSPEAQDRLHPPRIELARLSVEQYRYTVSDLIGTFTNSPTAWAKEPGLKAEYFTGRGFDAKNRKIERIEPELAQDFGTKAPEPIDGVKGFSARWRGGLLPAETGDHDIIVHTDHAVRVWVNNERKPLIDAWVKSGTDTEFRATVALTTGRPVPIRVEFSKAKQGVVNDPNKNKKLPPPPPAFIRLEWKRPGRPAEVIPVRHLATGLYRPVYTVTTPFPPDDKSLGWIRATTVSKQWEQGVTDSALTTSQELVEIASGGKDAPKMEDTAFHNKLKAVAMTFAERAFRRPLTEGEKVLFVNRFFTPKVDPKLALRQSAVLVMISPRFLYREVMGDNSDQYAVASRLSYALWDTMPDRGLLQMAEQGKLKTPDQVRAQAERMVIDSKATTKLTGFIRQWLRADQVADIAKSQERFPGFDANAAADLKTSLDLLVQEVLTSKTADFRTLLTTDEVHLNARLGKIYGQPVSGSDFQKVRLDAGKRAGVVTHPYILSAFAYNTETSPIHRGVFLARGILGINLKPPQEAFTPLASEAHPKLNTRERVALQTRGTNCQTCHSVINPLGFSLEQFDAIGRWREQDNAKPIDATGGYQPREGRKVAFLNAQDLAKFLVGSPEVHESFARQLFHHLAQQPVRAYGTSQVTDLRGEFAKSNYNIRKLAVDAAVDAALTPRTNAGVATR